MPLLEKILSMWKDSKERIAKENALEAQNKSLELENQAKKEEWISWLILLKVLTRKPVISRASMLARLL